MNALGRWAQLRGLNRRIAHEPLCAFQLVEGGVEWTDNACPRMCIGCLFVALRSDATYESGEVQTLAFEALSDIVASARAHLDQVLEWHAR